jgi:hypothetical protein
MTIRSDDATGLLTHARLPLLGRERQVAKFIVTGIAYAG